MLLHICLRRHAALGAHALSPPLPPARPPDAAAHAPACAGARDARAATAAVARRHAASRRVPNSRHHRCGHNADRHLALHRGREHGCAPARAPCSGVQRTRGRHTRIERKLGLGPVGSACARAACEPSCAPPCAAAAARGRYCYSVRWAPRLHRACRAAWAWWGAARAAPRGGFAPLLLGQADARVAPACRLARRPSWRAPPRARQHTPARRPAAVPIRHAPALTPAARAHARAHAFSPLFRPATSLPPLAQATTTTWTAPGWRTCSTWA